MMKRVVSLICVLMISFGIMIVPCAAVNPSLPCSLTLSYARNGEPFPDLEIDIYRVAKLYSNGNYALLFPFSGYPIKIHGITSQQEWQETAQTIKSYVTSEQIGAYRSAKTDANGQVSFLGLETGLYMVKGTTASNHEGTVVFYDFMVYLPTPTLDGYDYDIEAVPKYTPYIEPERYSVVKLWKDSGASAQRPESVCVDILKDGVVQEEIILNSTNNWSYSWDVTEQGAVWSVIEKDVPAGYRVSIANNGTSFIITNSKKPSVPDTPDVPDIPVTPDSPDTPDTPVIPDTPNPPDIPDIPETPVTPGDPEISEDLNEESPGVPKTGDTSPLLLYVMLMCISGCGLMLLGVLKLREQRNEKNR